MNSTYHILNGDALLEFFPAILPGEIIVARECLVDGPTKSDDLSEFWQIRAQFIAKEYSEDESAYFEDVASEFEKISSVSPGSDVNLWFEEDLFCQVNLWFCISLLEPISETLVINIVKPHLQDEKPDWRGFGSMTNNELAVAYQDRQQLTASEIKLLAKLWEAYKNENRTQLLELAGSETSRFPFLKEVVKAQLDRFSLDNLSGRPENVLKNIIAENTAADFKTIFREFSKREGIYGFGDWQVERLLKKLSDAAVIDPVK